MRHYTGVHYRPKSWSKSRRFPITRICGVLGVSQSGFFAWKGRPASRRQCEDMIHLAHILTAFKLSNSVYGSPRMHRDPVGEGHQFGRRRTARLMRENNLVARQKRRFKRKTDSEHAWPVAPNLIDQEFRAENPDRKWAADILSGIPHLRYLLRLCGGLRDWSSHNAPAQHARWPTSSL